jgi:hypothetical protein
VLIASGDFISPEGMIDFATYIFQESFVSKNLDFFHKKLFLSNMKITILEKEGFLKRVNFYF